MCENFYLFIFVLFFEIKKWYIVYMFLYYCVIIGKFKIKFYEWNFIGFWYRIERRYLWYLYFIGGVFIILMGVLVVDLFIIKIFDLMLILVLYWKWYFMKFLYFMEFIKYKNNYLKCKNYNCLIIWKWWY